MIAELVIQSGITPSLLETESVGDVAESQTAKVAGLNQEDIEMLAIRWGIKKERGRQRK